MRALLLTIGFFSLVTATTTVTADDEPTIPQCSESYGSLALREPENNNYWWRQYDLENPEALIKLYITESGCFTLVDRGEGMDMRRDERDLADSGELQVDSNFGKGQVIAADFFLIPDLINRDKNSGGNALGGALGGKIGGTIGGVLGGLRTKKLEADTLLTLVNARTSATTASARGQAKKTNVRFGGGGLVGGIAALGGDLVAQFVDLGRDTGNTTETFACLVVFRRTRGIEAVDRLDPAVQVVGVDDVQGIVGSSNTCRHGQRTCRRHQS